MKKIGLSCTKNLFQNIYRIDQAYVEKIIEANLLPVLLPMQSPSLAKEQLEGLDGLVLSGGYDLWTFSYEKGPVSEVEYMMPQRDQWEKALYEAALEMDIPVLGICRGLQLINVIHKGTLIQDLAKKDKMDVHVPKDDRMERFHTIQCKGMMETYFGATCVVNSVHHQGIDRLGEGLQVLARSRDGLVEAIASIKHKVLAVQFHPEREMPIDFPNLFALYFGGE